MLFRASTAELIINISVKFCSFNCIPFFFQTLKFFNTTAKGGRVNYINSSLTHC